MQQADAMKVVHAASGTTFPRLLHECNIPHAKTHKHLTPSHEPASSQQASCVQLPLRVFSQLTKQPILFGLVVSNSMNIPKLRTSTCKACLYPKCGGGCDGGAGWCWWVTLSSCLPRCCPARPSWPTWSAACLNASRRQAAP